jgi:hypothetical protein
MQSRVTVYLLTITRSERGLNQIYIIGAAHELPPFSGTWAKRKGSLFIVTPPATLRKLTGQHQSFDGAFKRRQRKRFLQAEESCLGSGPTRHGQCRKIPTQRASSSKQAGRHESEFTRRAKEWLRRMEPKLDLAICHTLSNGDELYGLQPAGVNISNVQVQETAGLGSRN